MKTQSILINSEVIEKINNYFNCSDDNHNIAEMINSVLETKIDKLIAWEKNGCKVCSSCEQDIL